MEVATSEMSLKCHKQTWWMLWMSLVPSDHFRFDPDKSGFLDKEDRCYQCHVDKKLGNAAA